MKPDARKINITIQIRGEADERTARELEDKVISFMRTPDPTKLSKRLQL